VDVAIMLWEWGAYFTKKRRGRARRQDSTWARNAPNTTPSDWPRAWQLCECATDQDGAIADGYAEGIALDTYGNLSEGSGQNIFIRPRWRHLHAAGFGNSVLWGITGIP